MTKKKNKRSIKINLKQRVISAIIMSIAIFIFTLLIYHFTSFDFALKIAIFNFIIVFILDLFLGDSERLKRQVN